MYNWIMTPDTRNPLGYCEAPISDFDDVRVVETFVGRQSSVTVKVGEKKKVKPIATVVSVGGVNKAIQYKKGEEISFEAIKAILPDYLVQDLNLTLQKNRKKSTQKIRANHEG